MESLCRQTEKLEDSRTKVDTLQGLLLRDEMPQESKGYNTEREQKLVDLLKVDKNHFYKKYPTLLSLIFFEFDNNIKFTFIRCIKLTFITMLLF